MVYIAAQNLDGLDTDLVLGTICQVSDVVVRRIDASCNDFQANITIYSKDSVYAACDSAVGDGICAFRVPGFMSACAAPNSLWISR